ncbi:MAG: hypothetical protein LIP01_15470 [Tannerellaceae bacterium]|nr:hypothetical protein [Tannerellaceae bacterium]
MILCTSSWAFTGTYAQGTELTVDTGFRTLEDVFKEIEAESEFIFFYRDDALDLSRKVNVKKKNRYH